MAKIKIVTDSSCGVTDQEAKDYNITIVPLTVMIDDTIYVERETITNEEFLTKMQNSKALPKTSQPPIGKFVEVFDKLGADDSQIICFNMLEAISGTVHAAEQAAQLSKADVTVVDSQTTDRALAFQVIAAAKMAAAGRSREEILKTAEDIRDHTKLFMGVMTLDNLVKGGRINRMTGMISGLLNIKIVLQVTEGELKVVAKGRGMKTISRFFDEVCEKMAKTPNIKSIGISHVGALDTIAPIKDRIQEMFPNINILVRETVPIIATHGGPGAFALMYYTGD
ncbi:DegV family protein [Pediococcus siamensis]|uniref:DegV family protein n=1 Tax=Pediococcus siamensis TaxID=381829 RepID=UPI0039A205FC